MQIFQPVALPDHHTKHQSADLQQLQPKKSTTTQNMIDGNNSSSISSTTTSSQSMNLGGYQNVPHSQQRYFDRNSSSLHQQQLQQHNILQQHHNTSNFVVAGSNNSSHPSTYNPGAFSLTPSTSSPSSYPAHHQLQQQQLGYFQSASNQQQMQLNHHNNHALLHNPSSSTSSLSSQLQHHHYQSHNTNSTNSNNHQYSNIHQYQQHQSLTQIHQVHPSMMGNNIDKSASSLPSSPSLIFTQTLHVAYNPRITDRGSLFLHFRKFEGFDLIAFYDRFCFVRFKDALSAAKGHTQPFLLGITTNDPAKQYYEVPYPQPEDDARMPCRVLHITHLPTFYTKTEVDKIFGLFEGFNEAHFYGKYGYAYFESEHYASVARHVLRSETNLVVSFAKNAPKPLSMAFSEQQNFFTLDGYQYPINDSGPAGGNGSDGWQQDNKPPKISIYRSESLSASANVLAPQQQQHAVSAPSSYSAGLLHQQHQQPLHFQYQQPPQHASIHIHHQPQLHHQFSQAASTSTPVAPQSAQNNITAIIVSSAVSGNQIKDVPTGGASIAVTSAAVAPVITSPSASASSISISSAANVMTPTAAITSMDLQTAVGSEKEHRRKATSPSSHTSTSNGDSSGSTSSSQQGQQSSLSSSAAALSLSARFEFDKVVGAGRPYGTIFGFRRNNGVILSDGPGGDIIPPSVTPLMTSGGVLDGVEDNSTETLSDAQAEAAVFSLTDEKSLENSICTASAEEEGVNLTSMSTLDSDSAAVSMAKLNVSLAAMKLDDATTSGKNILNNMTNSISGASTSTTASSSLPDLTVYQKKIGNPAVEKTVGSTVTPELSYSFAARRNGGGVNFGYHYNGGLVAASQEPALRNIQANRSFSNIHTLRTGNSAASTVSAAGSGMDTWHPLLSISSLEIWEQKPSYDHAIQSGANRLSSSMSSSELRTLSATSASGNSQSGSKEAVTAFKS